MKKIRLKNGEEYEIYSISDSSGALVISMLNANSAEMEKALMNVDNMSIVQYYVGLDLVKGYARYTKLKKYEKKINQIVGIDYNTPDDSTDSGFNETRADIFTAYLERVSDNHIEERQQEIENDVAGLKEDVAAINAALEGEDPNDN